MSIFGNRQTAVTTATVESYQGYVGEGLAGLQSIVAESSQEAFQVRAGMYISDVLMEEAVTEGSAQPEVLMEGFAKGAFGKIRDIISKLWAKVKAWFEKAKKHVQMIFTSGESFIKKFKNEIEGKASGGFEYEGYKYTFSTGNSLLDGKLSTLQKAVGEAVGFDITHVSADSQQASIQGSGDKYKDSFNFTEEKEALVKRLGADELSTVLKEVHKAYRGGKDSKDTFKDFNGNSKAELMAFVSDKAGELKSIEQSQKEIDEQFSRVLTAIDKAKSKIEGSEAKGEDATATKGKQVTFAQHKFQMCQFALSTATTLAAVEVDVIKEAAKASESVLKSFLRYKPAKEGTELPTEENTGSILEAAMKFC